MCMLIRIFLTCLLAATAHAELIKPNVDGFIVQHSATVSTDTAVVCQEMTSNLGQWWSPDHSFSGDAGNMLIDSDCFCERWNGNLVRHLDTTIWIEKEKVVLHGGLGPLKELGLSGTMIWSLTPGEGAGTIISWKYHVYGYSEVDLPALAVTVDGVLKEQLGSLVGHLSSTGSE